MLFGFRSMHKETNSFKIIYDDSRILSVIDYCVRVLNVYKAKMQPFCSNSVWFQEHLEINSLESIHSAF